MNHVALHSDEAQAQARTRWPRLWARTDRRGDASPAESRGTLDRDSTECLVSALLEFLMEGKHPETPKMTVEPAADAARGRDQVLTAIFEGIAAAYQAKAL